MFLIPLHGTEYGVHYFSILPLCMDSPLSRLLHLLPLLQAVVKPQAERRACCRRGRSRRGRQSSSR